jgi:hypothetical protein
MLIIAGEHLQAEPPHCWEHLFQHKSLEVAPKQRSAVLQRVDDVERLTATFFKSEGCARLGDQRS